MTLWLALVLRDTVGYYEAAKYLKRHGVAMEDCLRFLRKQPKAAA